MQKIKPKFYPLKPKTEEGFKKAVAWFGGRELVASLKGIAMYAIYGENMDPRSWMKPNIYPNTEEEVKYQQKEEILTKIEKDFENESKAQKRTKAEETSKAVYENLYSVKETHMAEEMQKSPEVQDDIAEKVKQKWVKKIFDYWEWKRTHFEFWQKYLPKQKFWQDLQADKNDLKEFWFDYIADSGDGQLGVYGVGCMCYSDLWIESEEIGSEVKFFPPEENNFGKTKLLPRGYFLFLGGDTAYHSANYATLFERFQTPFRWAFTSARKFLFDRYDFSLDKTKTLFYSSGDAIDVFDGNSMPVDSWDGTICAEIDGKTYLDTEPPRPLFGIPANHDYYDNIDGFNRQFRRSPFNDAEENIYLEGLKGSFILQIPSFSREQEASYIAIRLPFDWWVFGIDSENEKLDFRQEVFFKQIMEKQISKLILATPEPTTVFGKKCLENEKTATYLTSITQSLGLKQPFLEDGKFVPIDPNQQNVKLPNKICRLDLSGDVHHYARYWGQQKVDENNPNINKNTNYASIVTGGGGAFFDSTSTLVGESTNENGEKVKGEIPPKKIYPRKTESIERTSEKLFDLVNIRKGGYIQFAGAIAAILTFFFLTQFSNVKAGFLVFNQLIKSYFLKTIPVTPINLTDFILDSNYKHFIVHFICGVVLIIVASLLGLGSYKVNKLIKKIKEKSFEESQEQFLVVRITKLLVTATPVWIAIVCYGVFLILSFTDNYFYKLDSRISSLVSNTFQVNAVDKIPGYSDSVFFLLHLIISGLIIWLSCEYTNWLAVRFKITRKLKENTYLKSIEDPNEKNESVYLRFLGSRFREISYQYIPANLLIILSVVILIFGIVYYGQGTLALILSDITLTLVVLGGLILNIGVLAYKVGAAYQNSKGTLQFIFLGFCHGILQIATPFLIFYYANVWVALGIFVLMLLIRKSHFDVWLTNKQNKWLLLGSWLLYGVITISAPFVFISLFPNAPSLNEQIEHNFSPFILGLFSTANSEVYVRTFYLITSFLIIGYLGYLISRIWLSWYLAVSLLFDGHNNEVGGMARIQDFKHILRIKVQENKLTVYVIGLDKATPDLNEDMKLKLVDRFELENLPLK
ncbi:MAG: hypothetical protein K1X72_02835 [Pyrinomonadaceae bacterium]|nr:hypothetical protein [Pyrinomonadaceae bacterium]